ncbi:hypothetical protein BJY04DRAFT_214763 [Aspergillus karnatakaensis]|uniref:uncharacterized protein n=1 Tax=Aspergillus karnatakaensis TaxID=1810916 RepID=UPI003CCDD6A6
MSSQPFTFQVPSAVSNEAHRTNLPRPATLQGNQSFNYPSAFTPNEARPQSKAPCGSPVRIPRADRSIREGIAQLVIQHLRPLMHKDTRVFAWNEEPVELGLDTSQEQRAAGGGNVPGRILISVLVEFPADSILQFELVRALWADLPDQGTDWEMVEPGPGVDKNTFFQQWWQHPAGLEGVVYGIFPPDEQVTAAAGALASTHIS